MGHSVAGLARPGRTNRVDFALVGHQESWRAAADVLAALRGPEHTPLPDDEVKDILPWIPPRAVCHVDAGSIVGARARGLYIDSFIPPDCLDSAHMHDNIARVRAAAAGGADVEVATDLELFSAEPDIVICAASLASPSLLFGRIAPKAIVCDAGYPKNLSPSAQMPGVKVFFGGLGQVTEGLRFAPDLQGTLNRHPFPDMVHGCLLEGMALALEGRFEPFSQGRGLITRERVEEIETVAARHGIYLAPLYNADGPVEVEPDCLIEWSRG